MPTLCDNCSIRKNCDIISLFCDLKDAEVARFRPELIRPLALPVNPKERLRQQKRDHNARVRKTRRAAVREIHQLLTEYGTFGKRSKLIRRVLAEVDKWKRGTECTT